MEFLITIGLAIFAVIVIGGLYDIWADRSAYNQPPKGMSQEEWDKIK